MFDFEQAMMKILNDYYGEHRNSDHKEEIVSFIDSNALEIRNVINKMIGKEGDD